MVVYWCEKNIAMSKVTVSIVSHGHDDLVKNLLSQLVEYSQHVAKIVITHNIENYFDCSDIKASFEIINIYNKKPLGFGENHNQAFKFCDTKYFCVLNPDILLSNDPFDTLLLCSANNNAAITAPLIKNIEGGVEDSARYFPTPFGLFKKLFGFYDGVFPTCENESMIYPEWVGGMFMLIKSEVYKMLSGFDESFFLYYEDVDLCLRAWRAGNIVALCKGAEVVHDARRTSHREYKYFKWHVSSILKFLIKHYGRFPKVKR